MQNKSNINLQEIFFFFILILLSIGFYNVLKPLLADVFWALILVIIFNRPYKFFLKKLKNKRNLSATLTLLMTVLIIVIPLFFVGFMLTQEINTNYQLLKNEWPALQEQLSKENIQNLIDKYPFLKENISNLDFNLVSDKINEFLGMAAEYSIKLIQDTFTGVTMMILHIFVVLFMLYFMLVDGKSLLERIHFLLPLKDEDEKELLENVKRVTDAVVINTFMLGALEGIFGGILFALLGIPSPFFWGFIMTILSVIPLVGTNTVMIPVGIVYLLMGNYTVGLTVLIVGSGLVLVNQNLIRPRLDGNKSGLHTAIIFIGTLGGLMWMGIIGFLAGSLITGLFVTIWNQFGKKYKLNLDAYNKKQHE